MIRRIYIDNFRCLVNFDLKLDYMTVLLGPNGSGKSSVFEALHRLRALLADEERVEAAFPSEDLWDPREGAVLSFVLETSCGKERDVAFTYELAIEYTRQQRSLVPKLRSERLTSRMGEGKPVCLFDLEDGTAQLNDGGGENLARYPCDPARSGLTTVPDRPDTAPLTMFRTQVAHTLVAGINPMTMESLSTKETRHPDRYLRDFASWYRHLVQERQSNMFDLTAELREVLTGFDQLKLIQFSQDHRVLHAVFSDGKGEKGRTTDVDFARLSDGQRVLIALYTLLYGLKGQDYNLFLDEPENFVSLDEIQPWLMAAQDLYGQEIPQIVLISHHPEVIDFLGGTYGLWIERGPNEPAGNPRELKLDDSGLTLSETIARGWVE